MAKDKLFFEPVDQRANFIDIEKSYLKHWYAGGIVDKYLHKNDESDKHFSFIDGPITANNPMGVHHAWGRTYKDLWQRYHNMKGYKQRFQNGFDCQGLWVEVEVEKELELRSKKDIENLVPGDVSASIDKFVNLCKERVIKYSGIQTQQSKRLGNFMDWDNSYFTMSDENNYMIWHFLKVCHDKGWIYKGRDSVAWCPRCETAISQHEMLTEDYKEIVHKSIYLKLPIVGHDNEYLLIWTTTPWTIPANIAVAVDEKLDYVLVEAQNNDKLWVVKERYEELFDKKANKIVKKAKGKDLVGLQYTAPFDDLPEVKKVAKENPDTFHIVIATDPLILPISSEEGTGLVHTAVSAGSEDFKLGKLRGLPMIPVIGDNADYLPGLGELSGQNAKKHPEIIFGYIENHKNVNWVYKTENYKHRYPACWRCKTELVWKVADEWYISMDIKDPDDKKGRTLREEMIDVVKSIKWLPSFGLDRELDWLGNMHDWLISKPNRYWGLALPIYECKKCGNFEVLGGKDELKERAVEGWEGFEGHTPHKPWIDDVKISCSDCGEIISRLPDVGNVWLDAGIVPFSTIKENNQGEPLYLEDRKKWQNWFPASFITESFPGQFKNWFYSLIAMSTVLENQKAFDTVLGYALVLAEDGRPMHKSWGNSIEFNDGADTMGADVMRWMFASTNPTDNMLFGYKKADETRRQFHLKLWNVYNYFITYANTDGWQPQSGVQKSNYVLDKWIISRLNSTIEQATNSLDKFQSQPATSSIEQFLDDLSNWYIRRSRDYVGPAAKDSEDKEAFYVTCYEVLKTLATLIAPFTPYLADAMYINLTKEESVHLSTWPKVDEQLIDQDLEQSMEQVRNIIELGSAKRKESGIKVRQPLSKLTVHLTKEVKQPSSDMHFLFIDELNIKSIVFVPSAKELKVELDTNITEDLKAEGESREIIRMIQNERKSLGTSFDDQVDVQLEDWPRDFEGDIKAKALVRNLTQGEFKITKVS
jgi:isoleucyl-tRNA synthetase